MESKTCDKLPLVATHIPEMRLAEMTVIGPVGPLI